MVVNVHQKCWLEAVAPCVVAKCLAQGVAAYAVIESARFGCFLDDAVSLGAADIFIRRFLACKDEAVFFIHFQRSAVKFQRFLQGSIDRKYIFLPRFFLNDRYVFPVFLLFHIINIAPAQRQDIPDPQGGIESEHDQRVISGGCTGRFCSSFGIFLMFFYF